MNALEKAVSGLEADISDRRGLKREWEQIDADVKQEIRATWKTIIATAMGVCPDCGSAEKTGGSAPDSGCTSGWHLL
jgi:hypothetical protein